MRLIFFPVISLTFLAACSTAPKVESRTYPAGEKAAIGKLLYSIIDTQIAPKLGDDPANPRTPQNRFVMVQVSVSNSDSQDESIPAMTLVDDAGKEYPELSDGSGVPGWLGVVRKVGGVQTEKGTVVFDAPAKHYRLRLTDDPGEDIGIDVPLNFIHEQQMGMPAMNQDAAPDANLLKR